MASTKKTTVIVIGVAAVACLGAAAWMYQSKWLKEKKFLSKQSNSLKTVEDKVIERLRSRTGEPRPEAQPYGCGSFKKDCVPGDVGGCQQYEQSCASDDNSVRMTMNSPGECDQFRRQCAMGEYVSCDLYNRGCLAEDS